MSLRSISSCAALALALALPLALAGEPPPIELVQSVPAGTDLAGKDLRFAKDVWVDEIDAAKESIDAAHFYVANRAGSDLDPVLAALERAGKRGVRVRVLLSAMKRMIQGDPTSLARLRAIPGAVVETLDLSKQTGGILHAKYWIFDRREVFVGSQNLDWRSLAHIHELGLRLVDARVAADLGRIFERDLALARGKTPPAGDAPAAATGTARPEVELVASPPELNPPGIRAGIAALVELLGAAKATIAIQVLDYDTAVRFGRDKSAPPWTELDDALRAAAGRGVKVRLLVSHWNTDREAVKALRALAAVEGVEIRVSEFPRAAEGFIPYARVAHSKYMVVDGETLWLGTSNWLRDYFHASRNVDLVVRRPETAKQAAAIFERLWGSKYASPFDAKREYPAPEKGEARKEDR